MARTYWLETLGCPKNEVDSEKLAARMSTEGLTAASDAAEADLVVVNTCAFVEEAREESVATILELHDMRREGSELVVTGCMAERYGDELAEALPEVDRISGFGISLTGGAALGAGAVSTPVSLSVRRPPAGAAATGVAATAEVPDFDLLNLPRPVSGRPWAYVKVAEGCDKACGFCAIPGFRGPQRSRSVDSVLEEVEQLAVREAVLVAQDLGAYGRDGSGGKRRITELFEAVSERVEWVRLLYLYPSELRDDLLEAVAASPVPYFDLSLQHVSEPLVRRMRRPGNGDVYLERIQRIRSLAPHAATRSNFIVGYPGETEADHDELLAFLEAAQLDWCGFFAYSEEPGTHAAGLPGTVPEGLVAERLAELRAVADRISAERRDSLIGQELLVLVDESGVARSHREAPGIDGVVAVPEHLSVGEFHAVRITDAVGPDLVGVVP